MRVKILSVLSAFILLAALLPTSGYSQIPLPRTPSPAAMVQQTIGISTVTVNYSRPSVKGREIWGKLVPYGYNAQPGLGPGNPAPWRAGANENTVITFSHDAKVEGQPVPAGSYGLTFVINQDNSGEVVLSKDYKSWGSFFYDPKQDLMRAKIQTRTIPETEMLTYDFINDSKTSSELVLNWEKKQFPVKIEFDVDNIVMANARDELKGATGFDPINVNLAAAYSLQNKVDMEQGYKWANQYANALPSFNATMLRANFLKEMGKTEESAKLINDAMATATNGELNAYGYQLLGAGDKDKAIEVLTLNTKHNPKDANTWDSLGEAYAIKGDKKNAIINFKKSLSLNPIPAVKANSEKYLHQLGEM
jgi:Protein of unknown function (DUF2911)/Tetratricopeptide repeat